MHRQVYCPEINKAFIFGYLYEQFIISALIFVLYVGHKMSRALFIQRMVLNLTARYIWFRITIKLDDLIHK